VAGREAGEDLAGVLMPQGATQFAAALVGGLVLALIAYFIGRARGHAAGKAQASRDLGQRLENESLRARKASRDLVSAQQSQQRMLELLVNLPEVVNKMGAAQTTEELCRVSVRAIMELVGAKKVGLFMPEGDTGRFVMKIYAGGERPASEVGFSAGQGRMGQLVQLIGVRSARDVSEPPDSSFADALFKPDMCVAMRRHESTFGFLAMDELQQPDNTTKRVVQMLADVHAVSAEGVRALDLERTRADMDQLTGCFNRRHLDRRLHEEVQRARSYDMALSVFLFDIDNFKHFNDTNGHQAGDECLRQVAAVTRQVTRGSDVVCRYGGEEFLIILLGADRNQAWHHAERVRNTIASTPFPHGERQPLGCVSISGGVASFPEDSADPAALIQLADEALYKAKEEGRNRVYLGRSETLA